MSDEKEIQQKVVKVDDDNGRKNGELAIFLLMMGLSLTFLASSIQLFLVDKDIASTGGFPLIMALILTFSNAYMIVDYFHRGPILRKMGFLAAFTELFPPRILAMIAIVVVYLMVLPAMGFVVATTLFLAYSLFYLDAGKTSRILLVSIISVAVVVLLFQYGFKINLP
ncbi:MAG: tripartite tricarboxylate transporter TctB family protein [Raoultibacter sp.]